MRDRTADPGAHALDEHVIVDWRMIPGASHPRHRSRGAVGHVASGGAGRMADAMAGVDHLVASKCPPPASSGRVEKIHEAGADSHSYQHRSAIVHSLTSGVWRKSTQPRCQARRREALHLHRTYAASEVNVDLFRQQTFADRRAAGMELAEHLGKYKGRRDIVVLALPRGGVPVAYEVARALGAPLDVFLVRKLGVPGHEELAMGAIASGGVRVLNADVLRWYGIPMEAVESVVQKEHTELDRRELAYRQGWAPLALKDQVVVLVDDGLATGSSMKAAVEAVRAHGPARIVVAVPVGAADTCRELAALADEVICARSREDFRAVGVWYQDFSQTSDEEVRELLHGAPEPVSEKAIKEKG
jgi:putative phosphoribosyl transferase